MQVWSLVTRSDDDDREQIVWSGLYFVESVNKHGNVLGRYVTLYSENENYPLYESRDVGGRSFRHIDMEHIRSNGTLVLDDSQEITPQPNMVTRET